MNVEVRYSIIFIDIKRQSDTRRKRLRCASDATLRNSKFLVRYSIFSTSLFVVPMKILNKIFLFPACPGYGYESVFHHPCGGNLFEGLIGLSNQVVERIPFTEDFKKQGIDIRCFVVTDHIHQSRIDQLLKKLFVGLGFM